MFSFDLTIGGKMTISVCMIVKDEEQVIGRILKQVTEFADEIIVVDTGSKDKSVEIAKSFTPYVYKFDWVDDFSKARNYSFAFAKCDYIMWLDADDYILEEDIDKIKKLKSINMSADIYMFEYVLTYEKDMTPIYKYMRERLFKRTKGFRWVGAVHEVICLEGDVQKVDIKIYHKKEKPTKAGRNLKIYQKMKESGADFSPREQFYYARELMFNGKRKKAIGEFKQFLKREDGWVENKIQACIDMSSCYKSLNNKKEELKSLLQSFEYSSPRSEVSYRLGNHFLSKNRLNEAEYWYLQAYENNYMVDNGAFIERDMHDFLPCLQLCYVSYLKGDVQKSFHFHEMAKKIRPDDAIVAKNEEFFLNHFEKICK